jgi:dihydrofolate reductase
MWNMLTVDGFFEGAKSWDLEWHQPFWGDELERFSLDQLRTTDMLLFGRITYEGMASYWQVAKGDVADFMNHLPKIVVSRTLERADWANTKLVKDNIMAKIEELKRQGDGNIFVFGSGRLCAALMEHGLFDEYRLVIAPVLLGRGKVLFEPDRNELGLKLLEARPLSTGCVILRYEPHRSE